MLDGVSNVGARFPLGVQSSAGLYANTLSRLIVVTSAVGFSVPAIELVSLRGNEASICIAVDIGNAIVRELRLRIRGSATIARRIRDVNKLIGNHRLEDCGQGDVAGHLEGGAGGHLIAVLVDPVGELIVERRGDRNALDYRHGAVSVLVVVDWSLHIERLVTVVDYVGDGIGVAAPAGVELDALIDRGAHVEGQPIAARGLRVPAQEGVGIVRDLLGNAGFVVQLSLSKSRTGVHGEIDAYGVSFGGGGVDLHLHLRGDPLGVDGEVARGHRAREHLVGGNGAILILKPSTEGVAFANWHETACVCA